MMEIEHRRNKNFKGAMHFLSLAFLPISFIILFSHALDKNLLLDHYFIPRDFNLLLGTNLTKGSVVTKISAKEYVTRDNYWNQHDILVLIGFPDHDVCGNYYYIKVQEVINAKRFGTLKDHFKIYYLKNFKNKCSLEYEMHLIRKMGYEGIIAYNVNHLIPFLTKLDLSLDNYPNVKVLVVSPKAGNFLKEKIKLLAATKKDDNSKKFRLLNITRNADEDKTNGIKIINFKEKISETIWFKFYLWELIVFIFVSWQGLRWLFVPDEYNIADLLYLKMFPYECLRVDKIFYPSCKFVRLLRKITQQYDGLGQNNEITFHYMNLKSIQTIKAKYRKIGTCFSLKDFRETRKISYGSFGKVTQISSQSDKKFAMKSIIKNSIVMSTLELDIMAVGNIIDGIVPLHYAFESEIHVHLVMELMAGNLAGIIKKLEDKHVKIYVVELALGIEALHHLGIAHRDLKPANIMVDYNYHLKIGDFGCAIKLEKGETRVEKYDLGTIAYWAPENHNRTWTLNSDWFAYGCIIFEMIFKGKHYLYTEVSQFLPNVSQFPDNQRSGVARLLLKDSLTNWSSKFEKAVAEDIPLIARGQLSFKKRETDYKANAAWNNLQFEINGNLYYTNEDVKGNSPYAEFGWMLKNCLNDDEFRTPFSNKKSSSSTKEFKDLKEFYGVPIPIDYSVNILDHFPANDATDGVLYFARVNPKMFAKQEAEYNEKELEMRALLNGERLPLLNAYYFDNNDIYWFKQNPLIKHVFKNN